MKIRFTVLPAAVAALALAAACGDTTGPKVLGPAGPVFDLGSPTYTENWNGRGSDSERCGLARDPDGWIHWVFSTKGASTNAQLTLGGTGSGTYAPGAPLNANVWHFYTPYFDLAGLTATIELFGGNAGPGGGLVISDFCPGDVPPFVPDPQLTVEKDADATFDREHFWDIAKRVETDNELFVNGTPKIWLYTDGSGNEKATWTVDVSYLRSEDINGAVTGSIRISLGGNMDAYIASLTDVITQGAVQTPVTPACKLDDVSELAVTFPYLMTQGSPDIVCTYSAADLDVINGVNRVDVTGEFRLPEGAELAGFDPADYPIDESDSANFEFGDPENEINETVNIEDIGDPTQFGPVQLGSVTAPDGDSFSYYNDFAYADYGQEQCGSYQYDNTATIVETEQDASASLKVNVQCLVFQGETATGKGFPWSATNDAPNTWFEYSRFNNGPVDVVYGRNLTKIGTVTKSGGTFTFVLTTTPPPGWELANVAANVKIHPLSRCEANRLSYVAPGQFKYKFDRTGSSFSVTLSGDTNAACYGIHLDVGRWVPEPNFGP